MNKKTLIIAAVALILDQLFKTIIESSLHLNESIRVIKNFFAITYTNNYGAAWSLFNEKIFFLILVGIISLFIIYRYMNTFKENKRNIIAFGLLCGGIAGNLLDRIFLGYVRDFFDFKILGYDFPVFNISDMAIFFGVVLLIIAIIKGEDNGNSSKRKSKKN